MTDSKTALANASAAIQAAAIAVDEERTMYMEAADRTLAAAEADADALRAKVAELQAKLDPWSVIDNTGRIEVSALVQARADAGDNIPAGFFLIDPTKTVLFNHNCDGAVNPDGTPATFFVCKASATAHDCIYKVVGAGIKVRNIRAVGDRMAKAYTAGSTNEWGYGGMVTGEGSTLENCISELCTGDGFGIAAKNVTVRNCFADRNRRQGLSGFNCDGLTIDGGAYTNTGTITVDGVLDAGAPNGPWAGIDIEPDAAPAGQPAPSVNVRLKGVRLAGNRGSGVLGYLRQEVGGAINITVDDCDITDNADGARGEAIAGRVNMLVTRNRFNINRGAAVRANSGSNITVATSTADSNTIGGMKPRTPFTKAGIVTPYDLKTYGTGVINAGPNNYV